MTNSKNKPKVEVRFGHHETIIMKEMCRRVNARLEDIDFNRDEWYRTKEWDEADELAFKLWLFKYLKKSSEARHELMSYPYKDTATLERFWGEFNLDRGWVTKYEKKK